MTKVIDTTNPAYLADLKQRHEAYNDALKAKGVSMLTYKVPYCGGEMESRVGPEEGYWDTLSTCPHCGGMYMKISTAKAITALIPGQPSLTETSRADGA